MVLAGIVKAGYAHLTAKFDTTKAELDTYLTKLESDMREAAKKFELLTRRVNQLAI